MKSKFAVFFSLILIFFVSTQAIQAQPGCSYYGLDFILNQYNNYYVFVGKVLEDDGDHSFKVLVEENFRGMKNQTIVAVRRTDPCEGRKKTGESYLFAVRRYNDENEAFDSFWFLGGDFSYLNQRQYIELLRWKTSNQNNGIIVGKILAQWFGDEIIKSKPDNLDKVFLQNEKGEVLETTIEKDGFYKFPDLAPGEYTVFIRLPEGLNLDGANAADKFTYPVKSGDGLTINFNVVYNNIISGKILDSNNLPLKSMFVILYLIEDSGKERLIQSQKTGADGEYKFEKLKPADYIIETFPVGEILDDEGIKYPYLDENSAYPITFYPNFRKRVEASLIKLKPGDNLVNKNVFLEKLKRQLVTGRAVKEDGKSASYADILVNVEQNAGEGWKRRSFFYKSITKTNAEGVFAFYARVGASYKIYSELYEPKKEWWENLYSSECLKVPAAIRHKPLKLLLEYGDGHCSESERSLDFKTMNKNGNTFR